MNNKFSFFIVLFLVAGCKPGPEQATPRIASPTTEVLPETKVADLPRDAKLVVDRLASCFHFSGEFNGDGSERDKEVAATMKELQCDTIEKESSDIRGKYADNPLVLKALNDAASL